MAGTPSSPGFLGEQIALSSDSIIRRVESPADASVVFALCGDFDISSKAALSRALDSTGDGAAAVTIDLSETTFLDASTLAVLAKLQRQRQERGASAVRVVGPNPHVRKILSITKLDRVFDVEPAR
jgi:anti-sigma B factor antagonist